MAKGILHTFRSGGRYLMVGALALGACGVLAGAAAAKTPNAQYATISPLPGGGYALNPDGKPDGPGALQINIPVAYTPGWGFVNAGVFEGNHFQENDFGNGSGVLGVGFFSSHRVYMSGMAVTAVWNEAKVLNGQALLWQKKGSTLAVAAGWQDILEKEPNSSSPYITITDSLRVSGRTVFVTGGYGWGRFLDSPFGGVSVPVNDNLNAAVEWDGFQLNTGVAWRPGGRSGKVTLLAANNGHLGLLAGVTGVVTFK